MHALEFLMISKQTFAAIHTNGFGHGVTARISFVTFEADMVSMCEQSIWDYSWSLQQWCPRYVLMWVGPSCASMHRCVPASILMRSQGLTRVIVTDSVSQCNHTSPATYAASPSAGLMNTTSFLQQDPAGLSFASKLHQQSSGFIWICSSWVRHACALMFALTGSTRCALVRNPPGLANCANVWPNVTERIECS